LTHDLFLFGVTMTYSAGTRNLFSSRPFVPFRLFELVLFFLLLGILTVATGSFAQATKGIGANMEGAPGSSLSVSADKRINRLDANKDGQISRDEANSHTKLAKNFNRIDTNQDGQITPEELRGFKEKSKAQRDGKDRSFVK
jgi:hypothetical protein